MRAVDRRERQIQGEYEAKIAKLDAPDGRVMAELRSYGDIQPLVAGAFMEFSAGLEELVTWLAEARIGGRMADYPVAGGQAKAYVRQTLSIAVARAQADMLLDGLTWVGEDGAAAYANRHAVRSAREDEAVREQRLQHEGTFGHRGWRSVDGDGRGHGLSGAA